VAELKYKFTRDTLFKMLFVKHEKLLKKLVSELLGIKLESIKEFKITNPEIPPESLGDKFSRLDIKLTVDGKVISLEIQVKDKGTFKERALYYWARAFSSALPSGGNYKELPRTIVISIVDFKLFDCKEYYSEYQLLEASRLGPLTDKLSLRFYELCKLPKVIDANNKLQLWLALFKAKTEKDLAKIKKMEVTEMSEAIEAYNGIVVSPEFHEIERLREKARHDEAQAIYDAEIRGAKRERKKLRGVISEKDAMIGEKDAKLEEKDAVISELRTLIVDLNAKLNESR
jgi:predicted transposase/invertase (TIGR01784 family)